MWRIRAPSWSSVRGISRLRRLRDSILVRTPDRIRVRILPILDRTPDRIRVRIQGPIRAPIRAPILGRTPGLIRAARTPARLGSSSVEA